MCSQGETAEIKFKSTPKAAEPMRSSYLLVGTGSRSTAEACWCSLVHPNESFLSLLRKVGWLDVAALLELGACSGVDIVVPCAGEILGRASLWG